MERSLMQVRDAPASENGGGLPTSKSQNDTDQRSASAGHSNEDTELWMSCWQAAAASAGVGEQRRFKASIPDRVQKQVASPLSCQSWLPKIIFRKHNPTTTHGSLTAHHKQPP